MLRDAWFLATRDVGHMLRRRETILWTFLMPIVFFYFIGTITGGFRPGAPPLADPLVARIPTDAGFLAEHFVGRLEALGYRVTRLSPGEEPATRSSRAITVPPGFSDSLLATRPVRVTLERREEGPSTSYDQVRIQRALYGVAADMVLIRERGGRVTAASLDSLARVPRRLTLDVAAAGKRREIPTGFDQAIPGTMTMFTLLIMLTSGAILLVAERREGLLRRLAATPIPRDVVVLGKWGGRMALALVQIAFAMLAGSLFFRMNWGPDLPMVLVVLVAYAGLNASLGLVLGNLARTEAQAAGIGVLSANLLAALGGCWWPIEVTPAWMQSFALMLPTGWAMDALHKLVSFEAGAPSALPHLLVLTVAAWATGWVAARIFRYQ